MKNFYKQPFFRALLLSLVLVVSFFISTLLATALDKTITIDEYFSICTIPLVVGATLICLFVLVSRLYATSFRYASVNEIIKVFVISALILVALIVIHFLPFNQALVNGIGLDWCALVFTSFFIISLFVIFAYRFFLSVRHQFTHRSASEKTRILIVGAGEGGSMILREIMSSDKINLEPVGFVDDDPAKIGTYILGVKVLGKCEDIKEIAESTKASQIFIAMPSANAQAIKRVTSYCIDTKCEVKTLPGLYQLMDGAISVSRLRNVDVNDLLGRDPVKTNLSEVMGYIEDQVVLVTGGGGSIGSELCRQIAEHNPKQLIILDIYENNAYDIEQELKRKLPNLNLVTLIASIRDSVKMDDVFKKYRPDIVFHAAAHKHVPLMETSPNEAVKNNILGTYKVVKCAEKYEVKKFVQISTDKAVNPTNIMGATKRVCEMIIQAFSRKSKTCFVAVRFGNVLGSNGSVIPLFKKQIEEGGPVTVTHKDIIRYFMTIPEAVSLVLQAGAQANGGEIFVLDMGEQVRIYDLAVNLIKLSGYEPHKDIEIKITGLRPGEKLYEERLMAEEGLTKTANDRISIGKPLEIDDQKLFETLDKLYDEAYSESEQMKDLVKELVPTYKIDRR
ncbi:MAG: polysaccharide biosynthesis protein [Clostridia bacterium]|nr:polysaccharide biosynthesis protein [Clostridia bacterium]